MSITKQFPSIDARIRLGIVCYTSAHYVDKKKRVEIKLPLTPVLGVVGNGTEG